jgi:predicted enzyme related to lactoylglutathione lyase
MAYFAVAGADESSARAQELGGTVHVGPVDAGAAGRIAMIGDPNGTMFAIIEPVGEPE